MAQDFYMNRENHFQFLILHVSTHISSYTWKISNMDWTDTHNVHTVANLKYNNYVTIDILLTKYDWNIHRALTNSSVTNLDIHHSQQKELCFQAVHIVHFKNVQMANGFKIKKIY